MFRSRCNLLIRRGFGVLYLSVTSVDMRHHKAYDQKQLNAVKSYQRNTNFRLKSKFDKKKVFKITDFGFRNCSDVDKND